MHAPRLPWARRTGLHDRRRGERRTGGAHHGLLAAVVALALCASVVVVQHEVPEVDASTARESLVVLDQLFAADGSADRR